MLNARKVILTVACLIALCFSAGCMFAIGGTENANKQENTKGQELIDLKRAHEQGAIDDEEYEEEKQEILNEG